MKKIIALFVFCIAASLSMAQSEKPQKVVNSEDATNHYDETIEFVDVSPIAGSSLFQLSDRVSRKLEDDQLRSFARQNAVLTDRLAATKIFREVFTVSEFALLKKKNSERGKGLTIGVGFTQDGRIADMSFMFNHYGDVMLKKLFTAERLKVLFIKLRDRLKYSMPAPNSSISFYYLSFRISASDILLGNPVLTY